MERSKAILCFAELEDDVLIRFSPVVAFHQRSDTKYVTILRTGLFVFKVLLFHKHLPELKVTHVSTHNSLQVVSSLTLFPSVFLFQKE